MVALSIGERHADRHPIQKRRIHPAGQEVVSHVEMQGVVSALTVFEQRGIEATILIGDAMGARRGGAVGKEIHVKASRRQTAVLIENMGAQGCHCHYRVVERTQLSIFPSLPGFTVKGKPNMSVTLETLNHMPEAQFVSQLDGLYEHSPWIVRDIAAQRPFASPDALIDTAQAHVHRADARAQLDLICAHPELGDRQLARLTPASQAEQRGAGLAEDQDRLERLRALNEAYRRRHGFPFVIAVAGLTPETILAMIEKRLPRDSDTEITESLMQIGHIARHRLTAMLET